MIPFGDLSREYAAIKNEVQAALNRVLERGRFILGEELERFESEFAAWLGSPYVIGCASGTDAITLALQALGVGEQDEVIVPANTCVPTAAGIRLAGAKPVPVDVQPGTLMMDPAQVKRALGPRTKAVMPVHLYGGPADLEPLLALGVPVIEDCAQGHGCLYQGKKVGTFGLLSCFSFYPTKNLGAYGDAGAVATSDAALARKLRALRQYGQEEKDHSLFEGRNSRLDELQAAILRVKLRHLDVWNLRRKQIAAIYQEELRGVELPKTTAGGESSFHLYPVLADDRHALADHLEKQGIETAVHYPVPLHLQPAYASWGLKEGSFPVAERACRRLLSLPIFPQLTDDEARAVASAVCAFYP